jgi:3-phosphoshikimate 1-carboxyvinyltransferase
MIPEANPPTPLTGRAGGALAGRIRVPGDKSMSHRALMLGALAVGPTRITGLLDGEDVRSTAAAMASLGATVERHGDGTWTVDGVGIGGLVEPDQVLDFGNAGTGARLVMGLVATHPINAVFTGDASLRRRPMRRVTQPLRLFGAEFVGRRGDLLPMAVSGSIQPVPIEYAVPVPSAQVKSAVLLAALNTPGRTIVTEAVPTRDHSERMLRHFGARVTVEETAIGGRVISIDGQPDLHPADLDIPADPSSAAFPMVAALLVEGSDIVIENVGLNPLRTGLITTLQEMGGAIEILDRRSAGDEPIGDIRVRASRLTGITVPAARAASMIDEYPILAIAAAAARGTTTMLGLDELKVKESDRLAAIARGLAANGVGVAVDGATLAVTGHAGAAPGGGLVAAELDHRIAMSFLVLGLASREAVTIDDGATIDTSFPDFGSLMRKLGAGIGPA